MGILTLDFRNKFSIFWQNIGIVSLHDENLMLYFSYEKRRILSEMAGRKEGIRTLH